MIVTNNLIQNGKLDDAILSQIKVLCEDWSIRYSNSWGNDRNEHSFELGFKLKDNDRFG